MKKVLAFLAPIAVSVVLGPLIAGLAVCLYGLANNILDGDSLTPLADLFGWFIAMIIFAYVIGSPIAVLAGVLVSVWMIWRAPSAIVVIACAAIATGIFMGIAALGVLGPVEYTNGRSNLLFTLVFAVLAAAGCWLLTRRFALAATRDKA